MAASRTTPSSSLRNSTSLDLKVEALPGVGGESAKLLERLGIRTIGDLLWHLPRTYLDYSKFVPLRQLRPGKQQTVEAILGRLPNLRLDPAFPPPEILGLPFRSPPALHVLFG